MASVAKPQIKTRFLVMSDTHGQTPKPSTYRGGDSGFVDPLPKADVVLHTGDLSAHSAIHEFRETFDMLRRMNAPLKLVIAGNHDCLLDHEYIQQWLATRNEPLEKERDRTPQQRRDKYADVDAALAIIEEARKDGVYYLIEGTYHFVLENGAALKVFASPSTPQYGRWGFQYESGHNFPIPEGCDVAMTHGPPKGVLDNTRRGVPAGCDDLLSAVYAARPKLHCFGHIHEAWGARLITWREPTKAEATPIKTSFTGSLAAINAEESVTFDTLETLSPDKASVSDDPNIGNLEVENERRQTRLRKLYSKKARELSVCHGDAHVLRPGHQTLAINSAIVDLRRRASQLPWLVDMELNKAEEDTRDNKASEDQSR
jgi:Calcineurin-like phosphoesterase